MLMVHFAAILAHPDVLCSRQCGKTAPGNSKIPSHSQLEVLSLLLGNMKKYVSTITCTVYTEDPR